MSTQIRLEELMERRRQAQEAARLAYGQHLAARVDEALGAELTEALGAGPVPGWTLERGRIFRRFAFRGGDYLLVLDPDPGARAEAELRHVDDRFQAFARRSPLAALDEAWFLEALTALAAQVEQRLQSPRNFV